MDEKVLPYPGLSLLDLLHTVKTALQRIALSAVDFTEAAFLLGLRLGGKTTGLSEAEKVQCFVLSQ